MYKLDCLSVLSFFDVVKIDSGLVDVTNYSKGTFFHYEGDVSTKLHFLVSGSCKAYKVSRDSEIFLYELGADSLISDFTMDGVCALSNVEFTADSVVLSVEFDSLKNNFSTSLLNAAIKRVALLNSCLDVGVVFDAVAKVAHFLLNDVDSFNSLKRCVVAERLNISSETLSRVLNKLQKTNTIEIVNIETCKMGVPNTIKKKVVVVDRNELLSFL
jgi:CRP/FNR family transcriptional regulator